MAISVLMYHQIGRFSPMKEHRSTYCEISRFKSQMWFLKFFGYKVISIEELIGIIKGEEIPPKRAVVLTFDDGYTNFYQFAYPVLKKYKFPAIVYILSNLMGKKAIWFEKDGRNSPPLLDRNQIVILKNKGIYFGSHGRNHLKLAQISFYKAKQEIQSSKQELEKCLGFPIKHFCYPYGNLNEQVKKIVKDSGYISAMSCFRGSVYPGCDLLEIPRKAISYGDNLIGFFWKLEFKNRLKRTRS